MSNLLVKRVFFLLNAAFAMAILDLISRVHLPSFVNYLNKNCVVFHPVILYKLMILNKSTLESFPQSVLVAVVVIRNYCVGCAARNNCHMKFHENLLNVSEIKLEDSHNMIIS